jgi:DNA transposition AAA+ family ATPase
MIQIQAFTMSSFRNITAKTHLCEIEEAKLMKGLNSSGLSRSEYIRRKILGTGEMIEIYRLLVEIRDMLKANKMDHANTLITDMAQHLIRTMD